MTVRIAIIGDENLDYPSHRELNAARGRLGEDVQTWWVATDGEYIRDLNAMDAIWVAPGSPYRDDDAVLAAIRWAREGGVPLLGSCGGLQYGVLEFMRTVLDAPATHAEVDGVSATNAIAPLACSLRGEERLVTPVPGTWFDAMVGGRTAPGMHYCGYAATPATVDRLTSAGWLIEATAPDAGPEVLRLPTHPFYMLTLFQPQIGASTAASLHPMLLSFVAAARERSRRREMYAAAVGGEAAARPAAYVHQQRWGARWWKPLVSIPLMIVLTFIAMMVVSFPFVMGGGITQEDLALKPEANLLLNLGLATLIPITLFVMWGVHRRPWRRVLSVTGRLRWGWLGRAMALLTPVFVVYLLVSWLIEGAVILERPQQWLSLAVVTLLTTPLQSAGEEVFFRGGLVQAVGSWFRSPVVALVVSTAVSAALFGAAHGSADPWILIDLSSLAVASCYLSWRTGGLEAGIALHVVNNLAVTFMGLIVGGLEASYVDTETTGSPVAAGMSLLVMSISTWVLLRSAVRHGIAPPGRGAPRLG
jgi:membrane protease YdiL (CAAX protease family)